MQMSERSYAIDAIIDQKAITKASRAQNYYLVRWKPTWEPARQIEAQAPDAVEKYEKSKKYEHEKCTSSKGPIEIEGLVDESVDFRNASFVVRRVDTKERCRLKYDIIRRQYPEALIDFYESCIESFEG